MPNLQLLVSRDNAAGERDLGAGAIAGIIVGIVVVASLLLGLLVWRVYTYRSNRDFFNGRPNVLYPAQYHPNGHVRSTRGRHASTMAMDTSEVNLHGDDDDDDDDAGRHHRFEDHQEIDEKHLIEDTFEDPSSSRQRGSGGGGGYPSETNRASWWWRPTKRAGEGSDVAAVDDGAPAADDSNDVHSEVMASEQNSTSAHNSAQAHAR